MNYYNKYLSITYSTYYNKYKYAIVKFQTNLDNILFKISYNIRFIFYAICFI